MNLLLDTHIAIWAVANSPRLPAAARALVQDEDNSLAVSVASLWEMAIKFALRRRPEQMPISGRQGETYFLAAGYNLLSVDPSHVRALEGLPQHHTDPFDRMLVAQAQAEAMVLVTADALLAPYGAFVQTV